MALSEQTKSTMKSLGIKICLDAYKLRGEGNLNEEVAAKVPGLRLRQVERAINAGREIIQDRTISKGLFCDQFDMKKR